MVQAQDARARGSGRAGDGDLAPGRYWLLLAAEPASYALQVDLGAAGAVDRVADAREASPVRLVQGDATLLLQPERPARDRWLTGGSLRKRWRPPASRSTSSRRAGSAGGELPWLRAGAWARPAALAAALLAAWQAPAAARRRAEELLRLARWRGSTRWANWPAGMAHELNQPLTAVLANTQAARRLLDDEPPELDTARGAWGRRPSRPGAPPTWWAACAARIERPGRQARRCSRCCCRRRCATRCTCWSRSSRGAASRRDCEAHAAGARCRPSRWRWSRSSTTC